MQSTLHSPISNFIKSSNTSPYGLGTRGSLSASTCTTTFSFSSSPPSSSTFSCTSSHCSVFESPLFLAAISAYSIASIRCNSSSCAFSVSNFSANIPGLMVSTFFNPPICLNNPAYLILITVLSSLVSSKF